MKTKKRLPKMHEVSVLYKRPLFDSMPEVKSSQQAYDLLVDLIDPNTIDYREHFYALFLNRANRVLAFSELGIGDSAGVIVNVKQLFFLALKLNSSSILVCHNHPSGNLNVSKQDLDLTEKIQGIGNLFSIQLLDHIIITSESYLSLSDVGKLNDEKDPIPF